MEKICAKNCVCGEKKDKYQVCESLLGFDKLKKKETKPKDGEGDFSSTT